MDRRDFLKLTGGVSVAGLVPELAHAAAAKQAQPAKTQQRRGSHPARRKLVLVRLKGGNDGLNTLIPMHQWEIYQKLRPGISMPQHIKKYRQRDLLGSGMSMNPYLDKLKPWWKEGQGDIAWIQGVGYSRPILSHFESADVWETAALPGHSSQGWLAHVLPGFKKDLHGIVLGDELGPMSGKDCYAVAMKSPETFVSQMGLLGEEESELLQARNPALAHLRAIHTQAWYARNELQSKMNPPRRHLGGWRAKSVLGRQLESVAKMIVNGVDAPVYLVELDGFDTHANQVNLQNHNLSYLADALDSFASTMRRHGLWDDVLVMTYSEFGRRIKENRGGGTDHGAASVQLVMGGSVKGGLYGEIPDLRHPDNQGNLPSTTDFRKVYSTVAQRWLRQSSPWSRYGTFQFV